MGLEDQVVQLRLSVERFKAESRVDWQVGLMANALIEQAR